MANININSPASSALLLNHLGDGKLLLTGSILAMVLLNHLGDGKQNGMNQEITPILLNHLGDGKHCVWSNK